jgi:hypothetical protein
MSDALATIYSRSDAFKRKLIDALRNPRLAAEQIGGRVTDDLRSAREQLSAATDEGPNFGPASRTLAMKMAEAYNPVGMTKVVDVNAPMYHATDKDFQSFIPSTKGKLGAGVYLSPSSRYAEKYAGDEARVLPVVTRGKFANDAERTDVADAVRLEMMKSNPNFSVPDWKRNIDKALQERGFDGTEMHMERTVYDPSRIRSRFAAFDPARSNEPDLLAGMLPLGAMALPKEEPGKKKDNAQELINALRKRKSE